MKKVFSILMVLSVMSLFIAGCSKSDDGGGDKTATPSPAAKQ
jgi:hypothetical protein